MKHVTQFILMITVFFLSCAGSDKKDQAVPSEQKKDERVASEQQGSKTDTPKVVKTNKHVKVPHSNFYMILPKGFTIDKGIGQIGKQTKGFYDPNFVPMEIYAGITAEKYAHDAKSTTEKNSHGIWMEESLTVSGAPAKICRYQVMSGVNVYLLYFTGKWKNQMLIANYDEKDEASGKQMYEALKTVIVEDKK